MQLLNQMMSHADPPAPFLDLCAYWQSRAYAEVPVEYGNFPPTDSPLNLFLSQGACLTWILDLRTLQYVFVSGNARKITGYESRLFLDGGMSFFNSILHPDDLAVFWQLMKQVWDFLLSLPSWQRRNYRFTCDYRIRKPDGTYVRILEQNAILQLDGNGHITHLLGTGSDISPWKKSDNLIASLFSDEDKTSLFCSLEEKGGRAQTQLSKREQQVVKLLSKGGSSKSIADELSISVHTVNTHRQKIMEKTQTHNTGGAVQYALSRGLI
ncbi:LuxR C-terminal-related transcriptional regulator [soil metagenome]